MKIRSVSSSVIFITIITCAIQTSAVQQPTERVIRRLPVEENEPLVITDTKVNGQSITFGQKFTANDDWIKSLVVVAKNKSDKRILFAELDLFFHRPTASKDQLALFDLLFYGSHPLLTRSPTPDERLVGIAPGETTEIAFSVRKFDDLQQFLTSVGFSQSIEKVDLRI